MPPKSRGRGGARGRGAPVVGRGRGRGGARGGGGGVSKAPTLSTLSKPKLGINKPAGKGINKPDTQGTLDLVRVGAR